MPVLHIAERATALTEVDPMTVAIAALALGVALAAIWLPAVLRRAALRRRAMGGALALLTTLAVLPAAAPIDHLLAEPAEADAVAHREHCHGSPASCSDAPALAGASQFLTSQPVAIAPAMLLLLIALATPVLTGITLRPDLRPPLTLRFAAT